MPAKTPLKESNTAASAMLRQLFANYDISIEGVLESGNAGEVLTFAGTGPRNDALQKFASGAGSAPQVWLEAFTPEGGVKGISAKLVFSDPAAANDKAT